MDRYRLLTLIIEANFFAIYLLALLLWLLSFLTSTSFLKYPYKVKAGDICAGCPGEETMKTNLFDLFRPVSGGGSRMPALRSRAQG